MKNYFIIALFALTSCASHHPTPRVVNMTSVVPSTSLPPTAVDSVRYPENVKAYPVGRYVDPSDGLEMHERHTIYRIETTAKWNLHPDGPPTVPMGPVVGIIDTAKHAAPLNAEVIAEVNKQKAATQALLDERAKLDQTFSQLPNAIQAIKQLEEQNLQLRENISTTQKRLDALTDELRKKQADTFYGVNENTKTNEW